MKYHRAPNINHLWSNLIVEELIRHGIDYFCIAPGSRSAPLTCAVAQHPKAKNFIHFDERGLAFHALGFAAAQRRPCVLICTSGTAVANFLPAVIEASKKKLPLIILTADRPPELRQTGAHQTIDQVNIFGNYVRHFMDMPTPTTDIPWTFVLTTIDQACYRASNPMSGPVHINCMFREPLAPLKTSKNFRTYLKGITKWEEEGNLYTHYTAPKKTLAKNQIHKISQTLNRYKNGLIVVGKLNSAEEQKTVLKIAETLSWPIFPDISSGLRLGTAHNHLIHYFDLLLQTDLLYNMLRNMLYNKLRNNNQSTCILHLGGRITSKRFYDFVTALQPQDYLMVINHPLRSDPLHKISLRVESSIMEFCRTLAPTFLPERKIRWLPRSTNYQTRLTEN